jgi:hypothetical protein
MHARIARIVERYGQPRVVTDGGLLRVEVGELLAQTLYALDGSELGREPIGVIVYVREGPARIAIIHVAVREDYAASGQRAGTMLAMRLINKVREVASGVRGVRVVTLMYQPARIRAFPVRKLEEMGTKLAAIRKEDSHVH